MPPPAKATNHDRARRSGLAAADEDGDAVAVVELERDDVAQQDAVRVDGVIEHRAALDRLAKLDDTLLELVHLRIDVAVVAEVGEEDDLDRVEENFLRTSPTFAAVFSMAATMRLSSSLARSSPVVTSDPTIVSMAPSASSPWAMAAKGTSSASISTATSGSLRLTVPMGAQQVTDGTPS